MDSSTVRHHKLMRKFIFAFIALVFAGTTYIFITGAVDYYVNKGPCNQRGGYYTSGQCVIGPVVVER